MRSRDHPYHLAKRNCGAEAGCEFCLTLRNLILSEISFTADNSVRDELLQRLETPQPVLIKLQYRWEPYEDDGRKDPPRNLMTLDAWVYFLKDFDYLIFQFLVEGYEGRSVLCLFQESSLR